jgi:hypothetical protein
MSPDSHNSHSARDALNLWLVWPWQKYNVNQAVGDNTRAKKTLELVQF